MDKKVLILSIVVLILILCNVFLAVKYISLIKQLDQSSKNIAENTRIKFFNNVFIEKVLKAKGEVSYEDRLRLENAALGTENEEMAKAWHELLLSQTEEEAQQRVIKLLTLFAK